MRFPLVGEALAIDLANTVICERGAESDLLADEAGVGEWLQVHARQLPGGPVDGAALRAFRDTLRQLFGDLAAGRSVAAAAVREVNRAARAVPVPELSPDADGAHIAWPRQGTEAALAAIALNTLLLLASGVPLRACENHECLLHFVAYDRRRRFCSTARCSNRARQARHRARQTTQP